MSSLLSVEKSDSIKFLWLIQLEVWPLSFTEQLLSQQHSDEMSCHQMSHHTERVYWNKASDTHI